MKVLTTPSNWPFPTLLSGPRHLMQLHINSHRRKFIAGGSASEVAFHSKFFIVANVLQMISKGKLLANIESLTCFDQGYTLGELFDTFDSRSSNPQTAIPSAILQAIIFVPGQLDIYLAVDRIQACGWISS
jgi:hypothetical protein